MSETTTPNVATMNATELEQHIKVTVEKQKRLLSALRALWRARLAEESINN